MNIKVLDSWLKEYIKTKATPEKIAEAMSLTSVSIEKIEKVKNDYLYDIEITTNRPDLMSVVGLAREMGAVLPQFGIEATFIPPQFKKPSSPVESLPLNIVSDDKLVYRTLAVVMNVEVKNSPEEIKERLETSDIRSLNNLIDITNYVMRTIGHPTHVFDYDRLLTHSIVIREAKKGEEIVTLDGKHYTLPGGDIVADDGEGHIIDLLAIMGLQNTVVTSDTKRIVFFLDNCDPLKLRKTSMKLGIRTEAVQLNEKSVDPELAMDAMLYGISLFEKLANGTLASEIIDIYPQKPKEQIVSVTEEKIQTVIGSPIPLTKAAEILIDLGFTVSINEKKLSAIVPTFRTNDIAIPEDLIEEIARVYGYHNLPNMLPPITEMAISPLGANPFYWEERMKEALKYWGYTEVYTYPMVSEEMYEGPTDNAVTLANPLGEEFTYMRRTLVPSLLKVVEQNKQQEEIRIFEIGNVYEKQIGDLPKEIRMLCGLIKQKGISFFTIKGLIEQLCRDLGVTVTFEALSQPGLETKVLVDKKEIGNIEVLDETLINFELNFEKLIQRATLKKTYKPLQKYPPIIEDIAFIIDESIPTGTIIETIQKTNTMISEVSLLDRYQDTRTFHIHYQDKEKNLTSEDAVKIREEIVKTLSKDFKASLKS